MVNLNSITKATREKLGFTTKTEFLSFIHDHNKSGRDFVSQEELIKFVKKQQGNTPPKKESKKPKAPPKKGNKHPPFSSSESEDPEPPKPKVNPIEARINKKFPKDVQDYISEIVGTYMTNNPHPPTEPLNSYDEKLIIILKRCAKKEINPIFNLFNLNNQRHRFSDEVGTWLGRLYSHITWEHEFPLDDFYYPLYVLDSSSIIPKMEMIADFEENGKYPVDAAWGMANMLFTHVKDSDDPKEITFSTFLVDENTGKRSEKRTYKATRTLRNPVIEIIGKYKIAVSLVK